MANWPDLVLENGQLKFTHRLGQKRQYGLDTAGRSWVILWNLLQSLNAIPTRQSSSSLPVRVNLKSGPGYCQSGLISNPAFYEMVMGWPIGWPEPEVPVTEFAAWLQRSRGALCALLDQG
ncbi:hypothetical protein ACIGFJ_08200 [Brevundimonas diminuta]|uniref:hypothetical protein n=1 Tax=Brevundimonas diminuta TaxID=293 RepID=UPI0037C8FC54